jgi:signal transduction histidine kinase
MEVPWTTKCSAAGIITSVQKALCRICGWLIVCACGAQVAFASPAPDHSASSQQTSAPVLTNVAQVLALSPKAAQAHPPVQVRGMVTYYEQGTALFIQDETGGIFVYDTGGPLRVKPGQYVEVRGLVNKGRYSPIIDSPRIRPIQTGPAISPRVVSLDEINRGGLDAQWIRLTGVVRVQKFVAGGLHLELAVTPHRIPAWIPACEDRGDLQLEGNVVCIQGVVGTCCTEQGQLTGFQIFANTPQDCAIVRRSPVDAFSGPPVRVTDLRNPELRREAVGRVWTEGTVTLCWPGDLFIQDSAGVVELRTKEPFPELTPGTRVKAAGFLGTALEAPLLEDAIVRTVGTNNSPQPIQVLPEEAYAGRHNHELVEIEATSLGWADSSPIAATLALQVQRHFATAMLDLTHNKGVLPSIEPGSRLRLRGICCTDRGPAGAQPAICLLLRSLSDVKVIDTPASVHVVWRQVPVAVATLTGLGLLGALWYTQKQRRQTEHILQLQATLQAEMLQGEQQLRRSMEERDRMGRDLHDDIIQSIYSVGLNLEDCRRVVRQSPQQAEARVVSAINTLNSTIRSVRGFLAGLEPKVLNGREFRTALKSLALTSGDGPTPFQIEVDPSAANSLTSVQATQLLHIAKEAMSNSLRHGRAPSVAVSLHPVLTGVRLEVRDNGVGFNAEATTGQGHGLRNMTSRAREIGAELQIISAPGQGCRIIATLPQRKPNEPS